MSELVEKLTRNLAEATVLRVGERGLQNAEKNKEYFGKSIDDLPDINGPKSESAAIVVVAGPSLYRTNSVDAILASGFRGEIVASESALGYCLGKGLIPKYIVCLDPHAKRIVRWFGDPDLVDVPEDDYYRRQDFDKQHWKDELGYNRKLVELINRHGKSIKALLSTSVDISVTKRCVQAGFDIYWWNPLYDDHSKPNSVSRKLFESNRIPCMVTGGNVGTAAWIIAHAVIRKKHVALVGMDLGYAPGTPLINTQYYYELVELLGDRAPESFIHTYNPYLDQTWFADPAFHWYKQIFLDLAKDADCTTYNCTEGGTLFGEPIQFTRLAEFLSRFAKKAG